MNAMFSLFKTNILKRVATTLCILVILLSAFYFLYAETELPPSRLFKKVDTQAQGYWDHEILPGVPSPRLRNIFFVESSCALLDVPSKASRVNLTTEFGGLQLTARSACALEAAARTHPERPVYLVHLCPIDFAKMWNTAPKYVLEVLSMPNVYLWPVRMSELFVNTSFERLLTDKNLGSSEHPAEHASDILRMYLLWRYGGTYMDSDVYMLRSLGDMQNFAGAKESNSINSINGAILDFAFDKTGREVLKACIHELQDFNPVNYVSNGPQLLSRVISKRCHVKRFTSSVTSTQCGGFNVLPISAFYAVHYKNYSAFFREEGAEETMKTISQSIGIHVWNKISRNVTNIPLTLRTPFSQIVHRVCPGVVLAVDGSF